MITRKEVEDILNTEPTTSDEVIALLQKIEDAYANVHEETQKQITPYYDLIKEVHEKSSYVSKGLWEKRTQARTQLVSFIEQEKIKSSGCR